MFLLSYCLWLFNSCHCFPFLWVIVVSITVSLTFLFCFFGFLFWSLFVSSIFLIIVNICIFICFNFQGMDKFLSYKKSKQKVLALGTSCDILFISYGLLSRIDMVAYVFGTYKNRNPNQIKYRNRNPNRTKTNQLVFLICVPRFKNFCYATVYRA